MSFGGEGGYPLNTADIRFVHTRTLHFQNYSIPLVNVPCHVSWYDRVAVAVAMMMMMMIMSWSWFYQTDIFDSYKSQDPHVFDRVLPSAHPVTCILSKSLHAYNDKWLLWPRGGQNSWKFTHGAYMATTDQDDERTHLDKCRWRFFDTTRSGQSLTVTGVGGETFK